MKSISIYLILLLLLLSSCTLPLFETTPAEHHLESYLHHKPVLESDTFDIKRLPPGYDGNKILSQAEETAFAIQQWLRLSSSINPHHILVFSAEEEIGKQFLRSSRSKHKATGFYRQETNTLVIVGTQNDPRFWTILRHEAAHATLYGIIDYGEKIPFWLNEGIASIFEEDQTNTTNERLQFIEHLLDEGAELNFKKLVEQGYSTPKTGSAYARSWALVACLKTKQRSVRNYLSEPPSSDATAVALFSHTFLLTGETMEEFEISCKEIFQK